MWGVGYGVPEAGLDPLFSFVPQLDAKNNPRSPQMRGFCIPRP